MSTKPESRLGYRGMSQHANVFLLGLNEQCLEIHVEDLQI
jgi:hypothetical protein